MAVSTGNISTAKKKVMLKQCSVLFLHCFCFRLSFCHRTQTSVKLSQVRIRCKSVAGLQPWASCWGMKQPHWHVCDLPPLITAPIGMFCATDSASSFGEIDNESSKNQVPGSPPRVLQNQCSGEREQEGGGMKTRLTQE